MKKLLVALLVLLSIPAEAKTPRLMPSVPKLKMMFGGPNPQPQPGGATGNFVFSGNTMGLKAAGTMSLGTDANTTGLSIGNTGVGNSSFTLSTGSVLVLTGGLFIEGPAATSLSPLKNSALFRLVGASWNGTASVTDACEFGHVIASTTPTSYVYLAVGNTSPTTQFQFTSAGAFNLGAGGSIASTSQGATNTTGLTITPNVVDGASSIGLLINNATALPNGKLISIQSAGTEAWNIKYDPVTPYSYIYGSTNAGFFNASHTGIGAQGTNQVFFYSNTSATLWWDTSVAPWSLKSVTDNNTTLGTTALRFSNVYTFAVSDGVNASVGLNESSGSSLTYASNTIGINAADITIGLGGSGNLKMTPNKQFGVTTQAATNTTAMTIAPNVVDGATSVNLLINAVTAPITAGNKLLSVGAAGTEYMSVGYSLGGFTNGPGVLITGNTDASAVGPLVIKSTIAGTIGTAITMDATAGGGSKYSFISTGSSAGAGANKFAIFLTGLGYVQVIDNAGNVNYVPGATIGNINAAGVGPALNIAGNVPDGVNHISSAINSPTALTASGSRILSVQNAGTEKFGFSPTSGLLISGPTAGQASLTMSGSSGGTTQFMDVGGSIEEFVVTSLIGGQPFIFQSSNSGGFKFTGDATAGVGNHIMQVIGFASQTTSVLRVQLGTTPGTGAAAIDVVDSTSASKLSVDPSGNISSAGGITLLGGGLQEQLTGSGFGGIPTNYLQNTTAATAGVPVQDSPGFGYFGTAWNGTVSKTQEALWQLIPTSGTVSWKLGLWGQVDYPNQALNVNFPLAYFDSNGNVYASDAHLAPHYGGTGSAPSCSVGTAAGTGGTCSVVGTDADFSLTVTQGTGAAAAEAPFVTVTFAVPYDSAPRAVMIGPANTAGVDQFGYTGSGGYMFADQTTITTSAFTIRAFPVTAATTVMKWYVTILQ